MSRCWRRMKCDYHSHTNRTLLSATRRSYVVRRRRRWSGMSRRLRCWTARRHRSQSFHTPKDVNKIAGDVDAALQLRRRNCEFEFGGQDHFIWNRRRRGREVARTAPLSVNSPRSIRPRCRRWLRTRSETHFNSVTVQCPRAWAAVSAARRHRRRSRGVRGAGGDGDASAACACATTATRHGHHRQAASVPRAL